MGQDLLNVLVVGSIYTLFALGLTLSWGVLNVLNLAHGAIFMFAGIVGYVVTKDQPLSLWIVLPIAMIAAGLIALILEWVAYLPIRRRSADMHAGELSTMIASIAAASALVALAEVISKNQIVGVNPETFDVTATEILGVRVTNLEIIIIVLALVLATGARAVRQPLAPRPRAARPGRGPLRLRADGRLAGAHVERHHVRLRRPGRRAPACCWPCSRRAWTRAAAIRCC